MPYAVATTNNHSNICFNDWLGGRLSATDKRDLLCSGMKLTYKHFRVVSSETSPTGFHEGQAREIRAFSDSQDRFKVRFENGGHKESKIDKT